MEQYKKYVAEFFGTAVLVIVGCGTAVTSSSSLTIALAFGLSVVVLAYMIGDISGCHINPAITIGMLVNKKITPEECFKYIISQVLGAIVGAAFLLVLLDSNKLLGGCVNFYESGGTDLDWYKAFLLEMCLTAFFVLTVLKISEKKELGNISGIIIGLSLALVHIIGIPFTGTSVNPARSFAPAIFVGGDALDQVWLFILAPVVGAIIAGFIHNYFTKKK